MYSTVLGAAIKCKQYSEITVESGTHVKGVKITLNIFAVYTTYYYSFYYIQPCTHKKSIPPHLMHTKLN